MPKKVQISDDNGVTWFTFPGSTGEFSSETGSIDDTIFGAGYKSAQSGLAGWTIRTNGYYKGFAGYVATLKKLATPTTMTTEAMARIGTSNIYQVTNAARRSFSVTPGDTLAFFDGGVAIPAANIVSVDYLFGRVTLTAPAAGAVTVTGKYLPSAPVARASGFTLTQTADSVDDTDFATAQANGGFRAYIPGLKTASLALSGIFSLSNDWRASLFNRDTFMVEINPDGSGKSVARGVFMFSAVGQSGNVGAQEAATATLPLHVPDIGTLAYPFSWMHDPTTTLNVAIQKAMNAWINNLVYEYRYLEDGTNGYQGQGIITDLSLGGGLEVMNDFTIHVQGSGPASPVP